MRRFTWHWGAIGTLGLFALMLWVANSAMRGGDGVRFRAIGGSDPCDDRLGNCGSAASSSGNSSDGGGTGSGGVSSDGQASSAQDSSAGGGTSTGGGTSAGGQSSAAESSSGGQSSGVGTSSAGAQSSSCACGDSNILCAPGQTQECVSCQWVCVGTSSASSAAPVSSAVSSSSRSSRSSSVSLPFCDKGPDSPDRKVIGFFAGNGGISTPYTDYRIIRPSEDDPSPFNRLILASNYTPHLSTHPFATPTMIRPDFFAVDVSTGAWVTQSVAVEGMSVTVYAADIDDDPRLAGYRREIDDVFILKTYDQKSGYGSEYAVQRAFDDTFQSQEPINNAERVDGIYGLADTIRIDGDAAADSIFPDGNVYGKIDTAGGLTTDPAMAEIYVLGAVEISFVYFDTRTCIYKPACSDGFDNDKDNVTDAADPGCHTDGNPANPLSYDPDDNDEYTDGPAQCGDRWDNSDEEDERADYGPDACGDPGCFDFWDNEEIDPYFPPGTEPVIVCPVSSSSRSSSSSRRSSVSSTRSSLRPSSRSSSRVSSSSSIRPSSRSSSRASSSRSSQVSSRSSFSSVVRSSSRVSSATSPLSSRGASSLRSSRASSVRFSSSRRSGTSSVSSRCTSNVQCPGGLCLNGTCTGGSSSFRCVYNSQCPNGGPCVNGICAGSSSSSSSSSRPGACTSDIQCPTGLCLNGACETCSSDLQCPSGLCLNGGCTACSANGQCASGLCIDGRCTEAACASDVQCATRRCVGGFCARCADDRQCASGRCEAGVCAALSCSDNVQCASGLCIDGICQLCTVGAQCASGMCDEGMCAPPFGAAQTLPAQIIELSFSDPRSGGIGGACSTDVHCPGGRCMNGFCVAAACTYHEQCVSGVCLNGSCSWCASDDHCGSGSRCLQGSCVASAGSVPRTVESGPGALLMMAGGAAAGYAWMRRRQFV